MLPFVIGGAVVVAIGAYLLDSTAEENNVARKDYNDTRKKSVANIKSSYQRAAHRDTTDKLYKMKKAKQKAADSIYSEIGSEKEILQKINDELYEAKAALDTLFYRKRHAYCHEEKRALQKEIDIILQSRKGLFVIKPKSP